MYTCILQFLSSQQSFDFFLLMSHGINLDYCGCQGHLVINWQNKLLTKLCYIAESTAYSVYHREFFVEYVLWI